MKAKNREEFEKAWNDHFADLSSLASSLPSEAGIALNYLDEVKALKRYIEIAGKHTFPDKGGKQ